MGHSNHAEKAPGHSCGSERASLVPLGWWCGKEGCSAASESPCPLLEYSHCGGTSVGTICHLVSKHRADFLFSVNESRPHVLLIAIR